MERPTPEQQLADRGIVLCSGEIDRETATALCSSALAVAGTLASAAIAGSPPAPLQIHLNSVGGYVNEGQRILDTLRHIRLTLKVPVHVYVFGQAASMAVFVLQAADFRVIGKHSHLVLHTFTWNNSGPDYQIYGDQLKLRELRLAAYSQLLAERTGQHDAAWWREFGWGREEQYLSAEDALTLGLVDRID